MSTSSRIHLVFWGAVFALLAIRIDNVDILPDLLGYVLLVIGCSGLGRLSGKFAVARVLWAVLAVLSVVPGWYLGTRSTAFAYLVQVLQGGGLWFHLGGMIDFANTERRPDLVKRLTRRRMAFMVLSVLTVSYQHLLAAPLGDVSGIVVSVTVIAMILTVFMILHVILRMQREMAVYVSDDLRDMKGSPVFTALTILAAGGLGIFFFSQHSGYRSTTFSGANFHAKSVDECKVVNADLDNLLQSRGYTGHYQPSSMDQFAGMHRSDSKDVWLKSDLEEFKGIYLNVSRSPATICISTKWEHEGFKGGEVRTERKAYELSLELARWFHVRPERAVFLSDSDDTGIKYFEKSLAELPAE